MSARTDCQFFAARTYSTFCVVRKCTRSAGMRRGVRRFGVFCFLLPRWRLLPVWVRPLGSCGADEASMDRSLAIRRRRMQAAARPLSPGDPSAGQPRSTVAGGMRRTWPVASGCPQKAYGNCMFRAIGSLPCAHAAERLEDTGKVVAPTQGCREMSPPRQLALPESLTGQRLLAALPAR